MVAIRRSKVSIIGTRVGSGVVVLSIFVTVSVSLRFLWMFGRLSRMFGFL